MARSQQPFKHCVSKRHAYFYITFCIVLLLTLAALPMWLTVSFAVHVVAPLDYNIMYLFNYCNYTLHRECYHTLIIWWPDHSPNASTAPGIAQYLACANLLLKCYKGLMHDNLVDGRQRYTLCVEGSWFFVVVPQFQMTFGRSIDYIYCLPSTRLCWTITDNSFTFPPLFPGMFTHHRLVNL